MSYVKQGEDALQKAIGILSEQEGWIIETVAVSIKRGTSELINKDSVYIAAGVNKM